MQAFPLILASMLAMTGIIAVRYLLSSGGFALATRLTRPGLYAGLDRQMRAEIRW
jgi:lathosterol oxidase